MNAQGGRATPRADLICVSALPLSSSLTVVSLINLSDLPFPHLKMGLMVFMWLSYCDE